MAYQGLKIIAVVPARSGSKGVPDKNMREVAGHSLIGRVGLVLKDLAWVDGAVISTDSQRYADEARKHAIDAPFLRPEELSHDTATAVDTWQHALVEAEKHYGFTADITIYLEPTSPCRRSEDVERTLEVLVSSGAKGAATVSPTPAHYTPHKTLTVENGSIGFFYEGGSGYAIRQKIPSLYHRNGLCYALRRETLMAGTIIEDDCRAVVIDRPVVNVDDEFELELAEFLIRKEETK